MAALSSALDCLHNMQLGENRTLEYGWSTNIKELIVQFQFQLVRTEDLESLENKYQELLTKIFAPLLLDTTLDTTLDATLENLRVIYKLIGYTRDIVAGKGEYQLSYMLISGLYKFSKTPECGPHKYKIIAMAIAALESLVKLHNLDHPYGSWKDLKYFCNYHIERSNRDEQSLSNLDDPLFIKALDLICGQLKCDETAPQKSLVAKWIPREKSDKFGWLAAPLAMRYYSQWITTSLSPSQYSAARRKCLTHFRKLVSKINKELNTPQINQCAGTWRDINFDKNVTSITLRKQSQAFQGITKGKGATIRPKVESSLDRLQCKKNYETYVSRCVKGESIAKGKRVSLVDFVKDAINISTSNSIEREMLNSQWLNNGSRNKSLGNAIAMVDTSGSMEDENCVPLYSAIGLGLRIAETSKLGKRIITFNARPEWVNLDTSPDFVSMVHTVKASPWGMNTNFDAAFNMILESAVINNISPQEMEDFVLIILSDMQIDYCVDNNKTMFDLMKSKYADAGMRTHHRIPYRPPHIVFWNLRSTSGFPSFSETENTTMISGNSPMLLNAFSEKGITGLRNMTPWMMFIDQLKNDRYNYLDTVFTNVWHL